MSICPRCRQFVNEKAVNCPHCYTVLKAYGHPNIPLHQARGDTFLCDTCIYHDDDTCTFPQRPYAKNCTLYNDKAEPLIPGIKSSPYSSSLLSKFKNWIRSNWTLLLFFGLILVSLLLALIHY